MSTEQKNSLREKFDLAENEVEIVFSENQLTENQNTFIKFKDIANTFVLSISKLKQNLIKKSQRKINTVISGEENSKSITTIEEIFSEKIEIDISDLYIKTLLDSFDGHYSNIKLNIPDRKLRDCVHSINYSSILIRKMMHAFSGNKLITNISSTHLKISLIPDINKYEMQIVFDLEKSGALWAKLFSGHVIKKLNTSCLAVKGEILGMYRYSSKLNSEHFYLNISYELLANSPLVTINDETNINQRPLHPRMIEV
ncbi:MAG: hypothetical protein HOP07_04420 [Bacteriovoracaceae bacterium]|nr:hypothetical protein [Bacteriovoracaceae bacterium]